MSIEIVDNAIRCSFLLTNLIIGNLYKVELKTSVYFID